MRDGRKDNLVMVVDDNEFVRYMVKKWLGEYAEIVEIGDGAEVVDAYTRYKPDVLFLDIHLPGKNGKDILKEIKGIDSAAYVVMLSGDSKKENILYTSVKGAKAFITKPFKRSTLDRYYRMCPTIKKDEPEFVSVPEGLEAAPSQ